MIKFTMILLIYNLENIFNMHETKIINRNLWIYNYKDL